MPKKTATKKTTKSSAKRKSQVAAPTSVKFLAVMMVLMLIAIAADAVVKTLNR